MIMVCVRGQWAASLFLFVFVLVPSLHQLAYGQADLRKHVKAKRVTQGPIKIDGRLTEPDWAKADVSSGFVERVPNPNDRAPVDSRVRVLFDDNALYVAIENDFPVGRRPRALELRRDSYRIWSDDAVTLKFDVAYDRRTSINLGVNFANAQVDAMGLDNGKQFRREFDAVWRARSHFEGRTWTIEYHIPYTTLGLTASTAAKRIVGFNISRDHNQRNATYDWVLIPPELGPSAASHYGHLLGLDGVGIKGEPIRITPYTLIQYPGEDRLGGDTMDVRMGLDAKMRIQNDLWAELTAFTDFAEVDLDDELVNLTRFPLYLPEKRPFFLAGLGIFEFGARGTSQPFFSRRIGLDDKGTSLPIWAGGKVYGRIGQLGLGAMNVTTADSATQPAQNDAVARAKYTFDGGSTLGLLLTSRNAVSGKSELHQHTVGIDGSLSLLGQRLELTGFTDVSLGTNQASQPGSSTRVGIDYRGQVWQPGVAVTRIDDHYAPALGFVRRKNVLQGTAESQWTIRFKESPVSRLVVELEALGLATGDGETYLGREFELESAVRFRNGWGIELAIQHLEDVVTESFPLPTGEEIPAGTYAGPVWGISLNSPQSRNPNFSLDYSWTDAFYDGEKHEVSVNASSYFGAHLRVSAGLGSAWFTLPDYGASDTLVCNTGVTIALSPDLFWENNGQANTADETGRFLSRIRWRYLPGSDIFLVYQENITYGDGLESADRRVVLKVNYWWDAVL